MFSPVDAVESFKRGLNDLIDIAEANYAGRPSIMQVLQNAVDAMRYCEVMNARSSYHTSSTIAAPPSPRTFEKLVDFIKGA
jgi:hypothetical protein